MGDLDNTLIFYIWGDNGASLEGTTTGSFNEMTFLNGVDIDPEQQLELIERVRRHRRAGATTTRHRTSRPPGRGPATRRSSGASRWRATWAGRATRWSSPGPRRIEASGDLRSQFTHCIDVGPTILEAAGIPEPKVVDGIEQEPMDGTSFLYTFDDPSAEERHTVQYFEVIGSRAIYKDGWWACARLDKAPWEFSPAALAPFAPGKWDPEQDRWELYYLPDDFTQAKDLAAENPEKLAELKELFWQEAERNRVLPLLGSICVFFGILPPLPTVTRYTFAGDVQNIQKGLVPRVAGRSYAIEAELEIPDGGAEGVILANADFIGGFGLWVDEEGKLNHTYSFLGVETYKQTSTKPLPTGDVTVKMLFEADEPKPGSGGNVTLWANGEQIGEGRLDKTAPMMLTSYAGMDVSRDNGLVVDLDYEDKAPYPFTGTVKKVVFDLKPATIARRREGAARARERSTRSRTGSARERPGGRRVEAARELQGTSRDVVVTGTSTGIGAATALHLARNGFHVFAGVRRAEDGEALRAQAPERADAGDHRRHGRGDDLGGRGHGCGRRRRPRPGRPRQQRRDRRAAPIEFQPMADFRTQLEVNLFGPVAMIQAFLPLIRRGGGRIVNVGSIGGLLVLPLNGAYSASKFGIRAISDALRLELRAVEHPRVADRGRARQDRDLREDLRRARRARGEARRRRATGCTSSRSPRSGRPRRRRRPTPIPPLVIAKAMLDALTSDKPKTRYLVGHGARQIAGAAALPDRARDRRSPASSGSPSRD